jgi:hypothetical protein
MDPKLAKGLKVAEGARDAFELLDELGIIDQLRCWWRSRPRVKARRARRKARREARRS